jgi:hypothetical protein
MYINLRHRPLDDQITTLHNTPYITLRLLLPTAYNMLQIWYEHGFRLMASGYILRVTKTRLLCPSDGRYGVDVLVSHEFTSH